MDIPIRVDITRDPNTRSLADIQNDALTVRQNRATVATAEQAQQVRETLRAAVQRHSTPDPSAPNGMRIDHQAVAQELMRVDPAAGEAYVQHITDRETQTANQHEEIIRNALGSIDVDNADQAIPTAQYAAAVRDLRARGITLNPGDELYNQGRVRYWRNRLVGADKVYTQEQENRRLDVTQEGENHRHDTATGTAVLEEQGRNDRWDRPSGDAELNSRTSIRNNELDNETSRYNTDTHEGEENWRHVTTSPNHQGGNGGDGPISFVNPGRNGGTASRGGRQYEVPDHNGSVSFLPSNVRTRVSSPPGPRARPVRGASANHPGADYPAPHGTPILAEGTGTVVQSGEHGGLGNYVAVRYDSGPMAGKTVGYGHASRLYAQVGQRVARGQPMAAVGSTGISSGNHVHRQIVAEAEAGDGAQTASIEDMRAGPAMEDANALAPWRPDGAAAPARPGRGGQAPVDGNAPPERRTVSNREAVELVADGVQNYQGASRLSARGQSALARDARLTRIRATNVEQQISTLSQLQELLGNNSVETGYGSGVQQWGRQARQGVDRILGTHLSSEQNDARVAAYETLQSAGTIQAVEVLKGVGGNDTDRDFDRALSTAITGARSQRFNRRTAILMRGTLELGRDYANFIEQWASVTGSPFATQDGVTLDQAWNHIAGPRRRAILAEANAAGSTSRGNMGDHDGGNINLRHGQHDPDMPARDGERSGNLILHHGQHYRAPNRGQAVDRGEGQYFRNTDGSIWQRVNGQLRRVR